MRIPERIGDGVGASQSQQARATGGHRPFGIGSRDRHATAVANQPAHIRGVTGQDGTSCIRILDRASAGTTDQAAQRVGSSTADRATGIRFANRAGGTVVRPIAHQAAGIRSSRIGNWAGGVGEFNRATVAAHQAPHLAIASIDVPRGVAASDGATVVPAE